MGKINNRATVVIASSALALAMAASTSVAAEGGVSFSGNVGVTTDYRFRGISQSDSGPAVQGGFDVDFGNGFYAGTWASQVDFGYDGTDYEVDIYGGYAGEISESVSYDVGYIYYGYSGGNDEEYQEIYGSVSISDLTLGLAYSNEYWAETGTFYYPYAEYSFALPADLSLDLHVGLNVLDEDGGFLDEGEDSYVDYSVSLGKEFGGLALSASVVGTDISDSECFDLDWCEPTVLATATYNW
ncbi:MULTISPECIES: TorF family putative porin [unclassified Microbulbifer]|uniref:TorF family putative porin n=1 Tax=unclassified Microbulbifer TaxID=2619833 RepID=UPI0027E51913|nr:MULTISPECIES: TorF family putative porin [unclassified Microbulbifer]